MSVGSESYPDLAASVNAGLHAHYVLGFSPSDRIKDGKDHKVRVQLIPPPGSDRLQAAWKPGSYDSLE